ELQQQLHDGPHRRAVDREAGRAEQRDVERPPRLVARRAGEPRVEHAVDAVALDAAAHPPDEVLLPELRPRRRLAGEELQHHHAEAVHVALLRDTQRVRVLW
ncbi:Os08g0376400, partial [Oryza sativa Japonica Group]